MHFHLVCSPEFFVVAFSRKSTRKNHECGPFWPNFAVFAIVCHIGITISPWGTGSSQERTAHIVANDQGLNALGLRICSSGSSGVIQLLVRSTIPPLHRMLLSAPSVWSSPR